MKPHLLGLSLAVTLLTLPVNLQAATAPVTLTVKNYRALTNTIARVAEAASPGSGQSAVADLPAQLGVPDLKGVNLDKPWQFAVWIDNIMGRPAFSVWVPTTDFAAFESAFRENNPLRNLGWTNTVQRTGDYASIWIPGSLTSETAQAGHNAWKPEQLRVTDPAVTLDLVPTDALRQLILQGLGSARMGISFALSSQQSQIQGLDVRAMTDLLGIYIDVLETGFKGLEKLTVSLDVQNETLNIRTRVTALASSEFATWLQPGEGTLDSVLPYAAKPAPATFALRLNANPGLMGILKKLTRSSLQLQGIAPDSEAAKDTERLLDLTVPVKVAGTVDLTRGFSFAAVYEFPGRDAAEIHAAMKRYMQTSMKDQTGTNKPYASLTYEEAKRTLGTTPVDRTTMVFNLDAPLYKMEGQREMLENMWPGGRMEIDYARLGNRLFLATPDLIENLLKQPASTTKPASLNPSTVAYGSVNLLKFMPLFLNANPMVPPDLKERFGKLKAEGTDITFQVDADGTLNSHTAVPLRLLNALGSLGD